MVVEVGEPYGLPGSSRRPSESPPRPNAQRANARARSKAEFDASSSGSAFTVARRTRQWTVVLLQSNSANTYASRKTVELLTSTMRRGWAPSPRRARSTSTSRSSAAKTRSSPTGMRVDSSPGRASFEASTRDRSVPRSTTNRSAEWANSSTPFGSAELGDRSCCSRAPVLRRACASICRRIGLIPR